MCELHLILAAAADINCLPSEYLYHIETTAAVAPHDTEQASPPLWFFMFQPDDCDYRQDAVHNCHIPFGFWSLDKHPASIPTDIVFDPTPRLERIGQDKDAPLSTWIQQIGDFTFTTQAKYAPMSLRILLSSHHANAAYLR